MSHPTHDPRPVPELWLEQYLLDELPERHRDAVEAWLATDPGAERLDALRASNVHLLDRHPPRRVAASIHAAAGAAPRAARRWPAVLAVAVVCLVVAVGGWWWWSSQGARQVPGTADEVPGTILEDRERGAIARVAPPEGEDPDGIRVKGLDPQLVIYRRGADGEPERLAPASRVRAGDLLQVAYVAASRPHGVIVSIDGRGTVFLHAPTSPVGHTALEPSGEVALGEAYKLDDAPRFERFFFVTSSSPIDVERILQSARRLASSSAAGTAPLSLPDELEQTSVLVEKVQ